MGPRHTFELDQTIGLAGNAQKPDFFLFSSSDAKKIRHKSKTIFVSINIRLITPLSSLAGLEGSIPCQSKGI